MDGPIGTSPMCAPRGAMQDCPQCQCKSHHTKGFPKADFCTVQHSSFWQGCECLLLRPVTSCQEQHTGIT